MNVGGPEGVQGGWDGVRVSFEAKLSPTSAPESSLSRSRAQGCHVGGENGFLQRHIQTASTLSASLL